jgi:hypothetical protein
MTVAPGSDGLAGDNGGSGAQAGPEAIARYVKNLGTGPGVSRMLDRAGDVIYVGKAV